MSKAGLSERVDARLGTANSLSLDDLREKVDFTLAVAVVHEAPGGSWFFGQVADAMKRGGTWLLAEPAGHVSDARFQAELEAGIARGFEVVDRPAIRRSQTALLRKKRHDVLPQAILGVVPRVEPAPGGWMCLL